MRSCINFYEVETNTLAFLVSCIIYELPDV